VTGEGGKARGIRQRGGKERDESHPIDKAGPGRDLIIG
jgi:hypothetical protein